MKKRKGKTNFDTLSSSDELDDYILEHVVAGHHDIQIKVCSSCKVKIAVWSMDICADCFRVELNNERS